VTINTVQTVKDRIKAATKSYGFEACLDKIIPGLVLEFGVARGYTTKELAALLPTRTLYGFDSFLGLPEKWEAMAEAGTFACSIPEDLPKNVELVVGRFQDSLPGWLVQHLGETVSFVHIDCDLYSSTRYVLTQLAPRFVDGTVLAFDELVDYSGWENHEARAFSEFLNDTAFDYECLGASLNKAAVILRRNA